MDDEDLIPISDAAQMIDISINTLRRWDESGRLKSVRTSPTGYRYYSKKAIEVYLNDLLKLAIDWISSGEDIPVHFYCQDRSIFQARLTRMQNELGNVKDEQIQRIFSLVVAVTGEIGNNSFEHNIGNWPDIPGIFFGYDINKRQIVLADRGQGILQTLKRVRPDLIDDKKALEVAFTEFITGREGEKRGNGLKFVREVVVKNLIGLFYQTGSAELKLQRDSSDLHIKNASNYYRGCIAYITF